MSNGQIQGPLVLSVQPDVANSEAETRYRAIGKTAEGRSIFIVFTLREREAQQLIRPISDMHKWEITAYEKENS